MDDPRGQYLRELSDSAKKAIGFNIITTATIDKVSNGLWHITFEVSTDVPSDSLAPFSVWTWTRWGARRRAKYVLKATDEGAPLVVSEDGLTFTTTKRRMYK